MTGVKHSIPLAVFIGDEVRLRKPHPCGSVDWHIVRLGADIGLRCQGCNRRVLLPRRELERRLKLFVARGPGYAAALALVSELDASVAPDTGSIDAATTTSESPEAAHMGSKNGV